VACGGRPWCSLAGGRCVQLSVVSVSARGLLEAADLWPQEQQLCATAAEGVLLDLRSRRPGEDDPTRGQQWSPERRIRAQVLFHLLTGYGPGLTDGVVAVRLRGAQIVSRLNLGGWKLRCPLELYQCYLHCQLDLAKAEAPNISLRGSSCGPGCPHGGCEWSIRSA
jgi:hypothetical protein